MLFHSARVYCRYNRLRWNLYLDFNERMGSSWGAHCNAMAKDQDTSQSGNKNIVRVITKIVGFLCSRFWQVEDFVLHLKWGNEGVFSFYFSLLLPIFRTTATKEAFLVPLTSIQGSGGGWGGSKIVGSWIPGSQLSLTLIWRRK